MGEFFWYLFAGAVLQNVVLMTGFGSSMMLRSVKKRTNILPLSIMLCVFATLTVAISYPLDSLIGTSVLAKWLRPVMIVLVTLLLYLVISRLTAKLLPEWYAKAGRLMPIAAFNNLVIGIALIVNHQFAISFPGTIGLALGACVGFLILSWLTSEGMERLDNPDVPKAFRGLPAILVYLGILSLALMGFSGSVSLI